MNSEILLTALGALLILTAVVGGGFEIRELKIPPIGRIARGVSAIFGSLCLLSAIGMAVNSVERSQATPPSPQVASGTPTPEGAVTFRLVDELGEGQISEQVNVIIDGRNVGDLKVNEDFPTGSMEVTVPAPGRYDYTIASVTREFFDGTEFVVEGAGQGTISVDDGAVLAVQYVDDGVRRSLTLVQQ